MSFFEENINLLCNKYPDFKTDVLEKYKKGGDLILSESKSGLPTATVKGKFIHSNRDPAREAERLISLEIPENVHSCIVEGFGLGYYIEAILTLRPGIPVIITEPSPERFLTALEAKNYQTIFNSPEISLLIGNSSESIRHLLPGLPKGSIQIFKHRAIYELNTEYFREINKIIQHYVARREVNAATLNKFGELWVRNLINNLNILPEAENVGILSEHFNTLPILLLAAGPSLDTILPHLVELQKRFIIITVDTSASVLINSGVTPDFIVVVDPQYWNTRHLDRVDLSKTILISESSTHPGVFRKNHSKIFFCGSLFPLGTFMEKYSGNKKRLAAGGSVATTAWDFCRLISKGHLFCGGLDLGFPDNRTHFHGSFFEEKVHTNTFRVTPSENFAYNYIRSGNTALEVNNKGTKTLTDQRLSIYIKWFEEQISINKVKDIWNLSPLGIKIEGMPFKELKTLLKYPVIRSEIDRKKAGIKPASEINRKNISEEVRKGVSILEKEFNRLLSLSNDAIKQISVYRNSKKNDISVNNLIEGLDNIDKQIMESESSHISSFLLQPIIDEITEKKKSTTFEDEINNSEYLYLKIREAAYFHKKLVRKHLQNIPVLY